MNVGRRNAFAGSTARAYTGLLSEPAAPDVNEVAWDPSRDSVNERRSELLHLDPLPAGAITELLDPDRRRRLGFPLGARSRALVLGCTAEDLEALVNEINAAAGVDDDAEHGALAWAIDEFEALLGRYRVLKRDTDERTIARMPVGDRRRARELVVAIDRLQRTRYDPEVLWQRNNVAAHARVRKSLALARERGDTTEVARLEAIEARLAAETPAS